MIIQLDCISVSVIWAIVYVVYYFAQNENALSALMRISQNDQDAKLEDLFFKLEKHLRLVHLNFEHRMDYLNTEIPQFARDFYKKETNLSIDETQFKIKAELEETFLLNRFKTKKLKQISTSISNQIRKYQEEKCHLDGIVYVQLQSNCGFGCQIHTTSVGMLISYYWQRTLIYAKSSVKGMDVYDDIFKPVASKCKFHNRDNLTILKETIRPYMVWDQLKNDPKFFTVFKQELKELHKYHSEPVAFFIGHLVDYILRFKDGSKFKQMLRDFELKNNLTNPYVAIHVRRSDKFTEARYFSAEQYMKEIDNYFKTNAFKHSNSATPTPTVFVASDEPSIFKELQISYPEYKFVFNDTFTKTAGDVVNRYSQQGFESFLFDVYFLSRANYLVCTFTSNVCRLAYELMVKNGDDRRPVVKSLDLHYYNYFEMQLYQIAIVDNDEKHELKFKKGDLIHKNYLGFGEYEGYYFNGFSMGKLDQMSYSIRYASYKAKDFY